MVRVVIVGGGFGGLYTALALQKQLKRRRDIHVTLIDAHNFFLFYPLLPEAGLGDLEPDHTIIPLRNLFDRVRFVCSQVTDVDPETRQVYTQTTSGEQIRYPYDHLVIAAGSVPELKYIKGSSDNALTFQSLADALYLRNHVINCFELADIEPDPKRRAALMTFVIIGGGFTGVEVMGELEGFARSILPWYPHLRPGDIGLHLIHAKGSLLPEFNRALGAYAEDDLRARGVHLHLNTLCKRLERDRVFLEDGRTIFSESILVAAGIRPAPLVERLPWAKDNRGRLKVRSDMQAVAAPGVWAIGDSAAIPDPSNGQYPPTAQHALAEAGHLAKNIMAAIDGRPTSSFRFRPRGTMANLGRRTGVACVFGYQLTGFPAWLLWRAYYLARIPRWDRKLRILIDWAVRLVAPRDLALLPIERPPRAALPASPIEEPLVGAPDVTAAPGRRAA